MRCSGEPPKPRSGPRWPRDCHRTAASCRTAARSWEISTTCARTSHATVCPRCAKMRRPHGRVSGQAVRCAPRWRTSRESRTCSKVSLIAPTRCCRSPPTWRSPGRQHAVREPHPRRTLRRGGGAHRLAAGGILRTPCPSDRGRRRLRRLLDQRAGLRDLRKVRRAQRGHARCPAPVASGCPAATPAHLRPARCRGAVPGRARPRVLGFRRPGRGRGRPRPGVPYSAPSAPAGLTELDCRAAAGEVGEIRDSSIGASSLTAAELRLVPLLPTHLSMQEIGDRLHISRNTVKSELISLYRKLGVSSRSPDQRVRGALRHPELVRVGPQAPGRQAAGAGRRPLEDRRVGVGDQLRRHPAAVHRLSADDRLVHSRRDQGRVLHRGPVRGHALRSPPRPVGQSECQHRHHAVGGPDRRDRDRPAARAAPCHRCG